MADLAKQFQINRETGYRMYDYLGAHREGGMFVFRVWAPNADAAYVIGSFNGGGFPAPMKKVTENGIWEAYAEAKYGDMYKFRFFSGDKTIDKADPYAFYCERPPGTASIIYDIDNYQWGDEGWMAYRAGYMNRQNYFSRPLNIYELHAESWRRHVDGSYYSYRELADELIPYVKQMGYTHVELLPIMEYPYSPSWGYQICGYFAPTSRFGTPRDFMEFVDLMHQAGVGVILDWVPAHFPKDAHGLFEFDGQPLYEYPDAKREHNGWGTRQFDVSRPEVESFLISNAVFWASKYHIDGLRVDAVASMLYLDYDRGPGEWTPNIYGDNRCLEAITFFKKLNGHMAGQFPDLLMIAEESSAWPYVTGFDNGGLGFSLKWNMGWMHDSLGYIGIDPYFRKYHHNKLTFALTYAFSEKFLLPVSHDEVVHGKKSLLDRMWGDYDQKFATARAFAVYMMTHPGKKLTFMGNEIGQFREWDYTREIEWFLLDYESHARYQLFHAELNHFYLEHPELWENDDSWEGFRWIDPDNSDESIYSYRRTDKNGRELVVILNFTPVLRRDFMLGVPQKRPYFELMSSDDTKYGGTGILNEGRLMPEEPGMHGLPFRISLTLPPLSAVILSADYPMECESGEKKAQKTKKRTVITPLKLRFEDD